MKPAWTLGTGLVLAAMGMGCFDGSTENGNAGKPCPEFPFTAAPMEAKDYKVMLALGNAAPAHGHAQPTTHMYFMVNTDSSRAPVRAPVYAPADIQVTRIFKQDYHRKAGDITSPIYHSDYRIDFSVCEHVQGYYILVYDLTPAFLAAVGDVNVKVNENCTVLGELHACSKRFSNTRVIPAGTLIGYAGKAKEPAIGSLDFGVTDDRVTHAGYAHTLAKRQLLDRYHAVCPLEYFDPGQPAHAPMWDRIGPIGGSPCRTDAERCGKVDWEVSGTASGVWFPQGYAGSGESQSFVLMGFNGSAVYGMFSIAPQVASRFGIVSAGYVFPYAADRSGGSDGVNAAFDQVKAGQGIACFDGVMDQYGMQPQDFIVLAQVPTSGKLTVELRKGSKTCPASQAERAFTAGAVTFEK